MYFFSECKFWSLCWVRSWGVRVRLSSLALWCHGGGKMCFSSRRSEVSCDILLGLFITWILCWESLVAGNTLQGKASQLSRRKGRGWHLSTPAKCVPVSSSPAKCVPVSWVPLMPLQRMSQWVGFPQYPWKVCPSELVPCKVCSSELLSFPFNFPCWLHSRSLTSTCPPGLWSAFLIHTNYVWILFCFILNCVYRVFRARSFLYGSTVSLAWGSLGHFCSSYVLICCIFYSVEMIYVFICWRYQICHLDLVSLFGSEVIVIAST